MQEKSETKNTHAFRLLIVTGMSGSGKSRVARYLEDLGYFCVDNLPPLFIPKFVELCRHSKGTINRVVLIVDTRSREFFATFLHILEELKAENVAYELLFMDASDKTIISRYKETRRRHPLAMTMRISEGIAEERERLSKVRKLATYIIDTTDLKKEVLKKKITRLFGKEDEETLTVNIISFGFKYGMPLDADLVFDVRFLPNPFYIEKLRAKSGLDREVASYIEDFPVTKEFIRHLDALLAFLLPEYVKEGKRQIVIAIGCTGGMHRSVFIAEHLYRFILEQKYHALIEHRDLEKNEQRLFLEEKKKNDPSL